MAAPSYAHVVLDANAFIESNPSALHALAAQHWTVASVLGEVRDARARAALASLPFALQPRAPTEAALAAVRAFAQATGDLRALSRTDVALLALCRTLEVECNGEAHLRAAPPTAPTLAGAPEGLVRKLRAEREAAAAAAAGGGAAAAAAAAAPQAPAAAAEARAGAGGAGSAGAAPPAAGVDTGLLAGWGQGEDDEGEWVGPAEPGDAPLVGLAEDEACGGEGGSGAAAPSAAAAAAAAAAPRRVPVGIMTTDFAMQNVALQMGLQLLTHGGKAVASVKSWVLKCDACFTIFPMHGLRPEAALFCGRCGNATLHRLGVTLGADGAPRYHYKRFRQLSARGTVYAIPASRGGRVEGGGSAAGRELLLRADQLLMGGWKEKMRHVVRAEREADAAEGFGSGGGGGGGGGGAGWGGGGWAAPTAASLAAAEALPQVQVGHGRRNPNAARRGGGKAGRG